MLQVYIKGMSENHFTTFYRKKYTYPIVSQIRRRSVDNLLKNNDFDVKLSPYNWQKYQGSSHAGSISGFDADRSAHFHTSRINFKPASKLDNSNVIFGK